MKPTRTHIHNRSNGPDCSLCIEPDYVHQNPLCGQCFKGVKVQPVNLFPVKLQPRDTRQDYYPGKSLL